MKFLTRWTNFLNNYFDFGEKPLSNTGGSIVLAGTILVVFLLLALAVIGGPEQLPGT
ncbi:hypothetical protein [uncultured Lactobacillus sp.]|uniref:hypothetical protein n=1 Tax=uncultured Lactobacillus sp. TaxID=153152 RepID=UPI0025D934D9|nr:hypothetical protein [uncultured Lactobacillus sp.]